MVNLLFTIVVVFFSRKTPNTTWAWLFVILLIPYAGFIIYLLLGLDARRHAIFLQKARKDRQLYLRILQTELPGLSYSHEQRDFTTRENLLNIPDSEHINRLVNLNNRASNSAITWNNELTLFHEGEAKFESLLNDIKQARSHIHIQYYIIRDDELGKRVIDAFAERARAGVTVRLLVDGVGTRQARWRLFKRLTEAGGIVEVFLPPNIWHMNYRNHRKLVIIDGKIGYVGGLNIGNEYIGKVKRYGYWRDTHIRVIGDAVKEMQIRFFCDWMYYANQSRQIPITAEYFPIVPALGNSALQIVSSGPDTAWSAIQYGYGKMISEAERSIYIQTPYFSPDDSIFELLRVAALSGVDVRVIIPANPDHPFVYWASLSYLGELLKAGGRCYEYTKGFIHSKLIVIDSMLSSTGTANMDIRSFKLNFEVNAFIYDTEIARAFEQQFIIDLEDCREITVDSYEKRSRFTRIRESVSRLLSPIL